ncbi:MAG: WYL domain-containing protein [Candidatus Hinthialibacter sp.]
MANRRWIAGQKTTPVRDGAFRMTVVVNSLFEIGNWLLSLGRGTQVLRPTELAAWVRG